MRANIRVKHEVGLTKAGGWKLCFQWGRYEYDDGSTEMGYRFIWRDEEDRLKPHMGQARIPSASDLFQLILKAMDEGWFITCEKDSDC